MRNLLLLLTLVVCPLASAQIQPSNAVIDDLRELTDTIGGRPTGSAEMGRAVRWAVAKFEGAHVPVHLESYTIPAYWRNDAAVASVVAPAAFPLRVVAAPLTVSTPNDAAVEATLVDFGDGSEAALAKVPAEAKGKIAFVHTAVMKSLDDLFGDYMRTSTLLTAARKHGVAAVLIESSQPRSLLYRHPMSFVGDPVDVPVAIVAHDQAERVARLMERGPVRVSLKLVSRITRNVPAQNVVAEIRGSEKPNEIVVFGAHFDSWDLGTGALDNGINATTVIDVARQMVSAGMKPKRTIRFVLFTGEELGMLGSRAYVVQHRAEMPETVMMMTADIGSGKTTGFFLDGREELRKPVEEALAPSIDVKSQSNPIDAIDGSDNFDFLLAGVPNLIANQDATPYLPEYHAESDTFDKVDAAQAKANEALDAAVLWHFANMPARIPQQSRAEVEKLLVDTHLDEQMKAFGQWEEWKGGKRP